MKSLNKITANKGAPRPLRMLQFGGGNFLRGFVDWMIQILNEETNFSGDVIVVKPTESGNYEVLRSQSGLFTVVLEGMRDGERIEEKRLINCVQKIINPYTEWEEFLKTAENEELRFVVSNTTEAGITFNSEDKLDAAPPTEFPAKLTKWLHCRFQHFRNPETKGCIVLPCELVQNNGKLLRDTILQYANHWKLGSDFISWINNSNHFCNTLVDRIISGYPKEKAAQFCEDLGYVDRLMVAGEYYHSWVIEAEEALIRELPFEKTNLNVQFVNDLSAHRAMKVRILNGAHTAMVPVGILARLQSVKDCMENSAVYNFVETLLRKEVIKTLNFTEEVKSKYIKDILDRFNNPSIKHKLEAISLNSTSKFTTRLLPTLKDYLKREQRLPQRLVFGFSALIVLYKGTEIDLKDDLSVLAFFDQNWKMYENKGQSLENMVNSILGHSAIWGEDLSKLPGLQEMMLNFIDQIENNGILSTLKTLE